MGSALVRLVLAVVVIIVWKTTLHSCETCEAQTSALRHCRLSLDHIRNPLMVPKHSETRRRRRLCLRLHPAPSVRRSVSSPAWQPRGGLDESSHLALKNNLSGPFHDGATHGERGKGGRGKVFRERSSPSCQGVFFVRSTVPSQGIRGKLCYKALVSSLVSLLQGVK